MFGDNEYAIRGDATIVLCVTAPTPEAALDTWRDYQTVTIGNTHVRDGRATLLAEASTDPDHARIVEINGISQPDHVPTRITLDHSSTESLAASIATLDSATQQRIADALREAADARADAAFLTHVRTTIARELTADDGNHDEAVGVRFLTMEWENGYFLTSTGEVLLPDGRAVDIDFGDTADDYLSPVYGARGATFGLAIDLRTGDFNADDYHANTTIHSIFGVAEPEKPADAIRAVFDAHLAPDEKAAATGVLFLAQEHNSTYALTDTGQVLFRDGTVRELDFPGIAAKHLHANQPRPDKFATVIDLVTNRLERAHSFDTLLDHLH